MQVGNEIVQQAVDEPHIVDVVPRGMHLDVAGIPRSRFGHSSAAVGKHDDKSLLVGCLAEPRELDHIIGARSRAVERQHERSVDARSVLRDVNDGQSLVTVHFDGSLVKTGLERRVCYWITLLQLFKFFVQ